MSEKVKQVFDQHTQGGPKTISAHSLKRLLKDLKPADLQIELDDLVDYFGRESDGDSISYEQFIDFIFASNGDKSWRDTRKRSPSINEVLERQSNILRLATQLCGTPVEKLPQALVDTACAVLNSDAVCLSLKDGYGEPFLYKIGKNGGSLPESLLNEVAQSSASSVWATGEDLTLSEENLKKDFGTRSMLCLALKDTDGSVFGVLQVLNERTLDSVDEDVVKLMVSIASRDMAGHHQRITEESNTRTRINSLLQVMSLNATNHPDLEKLVGTVSKEAQIIFDCERCRLCAVDSLKQQIVGLQTRNSVTEHIRTELSELVELVHSSGEMINMPDPQNDPRFRRDPNEKSDFRTKTLLVAPLITSNGRTMGVVLCYNKKGASAFTADDEFNLKFLCRRVANALQRVLLDSNFSAFFGASKEADSEVTTMVKSMLSDDVVTETPDPNIAVMEAMRNQPASFKKVTSKMLNIITDMSKLGFDHYSMFAENGHSSALYSQYILVCFGQFGLLDAEHLCLDGGALSKCTEAFQSRYRNTAYHNWSHAFAVFKACFNIVMTDIMQKVFSKADMAALLIAALGHDVEHPGVNNQFLVNKRSDLAIRYNDVSVLESHHASVTISILSQFLKDFSSCSQMRRYITTLIVNTDMAHHKDTIAYLETFGVDIAKLRAEGECYDRESAVQIGSAMLHAADLSHPVLPWELHQRVSVMVCEEFFAQFQEEQSLGLPSLPFMGKNPAVLSEIAPGQVGFLRFVALPLWAGMENVAPSDDKLKVAMDKMKQNIEKWQQIADENADANEG